MELWTTEIDRIFVPGTNVLAKLGKGANITTDVLVKICEELKCDISDIVEIVPDDANTED